MPKSSDHGLTKQATLLLEHIFNNYKEAFDLKLLSQIGELGRINEICRHYDGIALTKREQLIESEYFDQITHTAATSLKLRPSEPKSELTTIDQRLIKAWIKASHVEKHLGTAIACCKRIIHRRYGRNEAAVLWRIACESHIFAILPVIDERDERSKFAKRGAEALHSAKGGSRDKRNKIREIWASGKYNSRDLCAEQECAHLGMSFSTARKALRRTPNPS